MVRVLPVLATRTLSHPRLQRPDLDEPGRRLLGEQAARLGERGELGVVDRVRRLARHDARRPLKSLSPIVPVTRWLTCSM